MSPMPSTGFYAMARLARNFDTSWLDLRQRSVADTSTVRTGTIEAAQPVEVSHGPACSERATLMQYNGSHMRLGARDPWLSSVSFAISKYVIFQYRGNE